MKILYLSNGALWKMSGNTIQILDEIRALRTSGHEVDLLIMPHRRQLQKIEGDLQQLRQSLEEIGAQFFILPRVSDNSRFFPSLQLHWYGSRIWKLYCDGHYELLSAHTIGTARIANWLKKRHQARIKTAYDMHGAGLAEMEFRSNVQPHSPVYKECESVESEALALSDLVFVVSRFFKDWVCKEYKVEPSKVFVTPSSTTIKPMPDADWREKQREELGIGNRPVLLYSGSMLKWQRAEDLIHLFRELHKEIPELFLLVLSGKPELADGYASSCGLAQEDYKAMRVPPAEVQTMMSLGDIGSLLRHDHLLNQVASPVKFADYLGAGVPVLISPGVGDCSEMIAESGLGFVLDESRTSPKELASELRKLLSQRSDEQRSACRELAKHFSWERTVEVFKQAFSMLSTTMEDISSGKQ